eukprot:2720929-Pleurochrysis_carterae.AAC.1
MREKRAQETTWSLRWSFSRVSMQQYATPDLMRLATYRRLFGRQADVPVVAREDLRADVHALPGMNPRGNDVCATDSKTSDVHGCATAPE